MKYISKIIAMFCLAGMALSCQTEEPFQGGQDGQDNPVVGVFGDEMVLSIGVVAPDPLTVETKAVDPDGTGIKDMYFFCFDEEGKFLKTAYAELKNKALGGEEGIIASVTVPYKSRVMHIVCNHNMAGFDEEAFEGMSEEEVIGSIDAASGLLMYWARIQVPANVQQLNTEVPNADKRSLGEAIVDWLTIETIPASQSHKGVNGKENPIVLLRNQAKVTVTSAEATDDKKWDGEFFKVTGFTVINTQVYGTVAPISAEDGYPTYESDTYGLQDWSEDSYVTLPEDLDVMDFLYDVDHFSTTYVFESPNTIGKPVDVIIKGQNMDNGTAGPELYYKASIVDSKSGLIPIRRNHHYNLNIVGKLYNGYPTFSEAVAGAAANNIWLSIADEVKSVMNDKFRLTVDEHIVIRSATEVAADNILDLGFALEALGATPVDESMLTVAWADENQTVAAAEPVLNYDAATGKGAVRLTLNPVAGDDVQEGVIIISYGQLFRRISVKTTPVFDFTPVWVSTEGVQGSRDKVTLVFNVPENFPADLLPFNVLVSANDLDIDAASGQRLPIVLAGEEGYGESFSDTVDGTTVKHNGYKYIYQVTTTGVQRLYFQSLSNEVLVDFETYITIEAESFDRHHQKVTLSNIEFESYLVGENLRTANASADGSSVRYFLVPQKVNAPVVLDIAAKIKSGEEEVAAPISAEDRFELYANNLNFVESADMAYSPVSEEDWGISGRRIGFHTTADAADGKMVLNLKTVKPQSSEVVYIGSAEGTEFTSITFELANYRAFEFDAKVNGLSDALALAYSTDQEIEVSFDVTSFTGADGADVDPFGTAFDIYIDAPMLTLGTNDAYAGKIEDLGNGRFVYQVDADRVVEDTYGTDGRKTIVFKPKNVSCEGDVTISSQLEKVVYNTETIRITDTPVEGNITYGEAKLPLGIGYHVSFYNKATSKRIYTTTINTEGKYEFYVDQDRDIDIFNDELTIMVQNGGKYYSTDVASIAYLIEHPDVNLDLDE